MSFDSVDAEIMVHNEILTHVTYSPLRPTTSRHQQYSQPSGLCFAPASAVPMTKSSMTFLLAPLMYVILATPEQLWTWY